MTERSLKDLNITPESVLELIPPGVSLDALRDKCFIPIARDEKVVTFAAADLSCVVETQLLAASMDASADTILFPPAEIQNLIRGLYDIKSGVGQETLNAIEEVDDLSELARQEVMSDSVDAPVVKLVNGILMESLRERATDIHIEPYEDRVAVRYRVDGVLSDRYALSKGHQSPVTSRIKVMANMDIAERFVPQDGRIGISLGDRLVDIRVSSLPTQHGERLVLRLLDKARGLLTLEDLGMKAYERERIENLIRRPNGMILCYPVVSSGPVGHRPSFENLLGEQYEELAEAVSIERCVRAATPPVFLWHTADDTTVPVENALLLREALEARGVPVECHIFPHGSHGQSLADPACFPPERAWRLSVPCGAWVEWCRAWIRRNYGG